MEPLTKFLVNKMFDMSMPIVFEASIIQKMCEEMVHLLKRLVLRINLISGGLSIGVYDNLKYYLWSKNIFSKRK